MLQEVKTLSSETNLSSNLIDTINKSFKAKAIKFRLNTQEDSVRSCNFEEVIDGVLKSLEGESSITRDGLQKLIDEKNQEVGEKSRSSSMVIQFIKPFFSKSCRQIILFLTIFFDIFLPKITTENSN